MTPTSPAPAAPPAATTPAFWTHIITLLLAVAGFVAGAIHPGYHLPTVVAASTGAASVLLAAASGAIWTWHVHGLSLHGLTQIPGWVSTQLASLRADLAANPSQAGLEKRIANLETTLQTLVPTPAANVTYPSAAQTGPGSPQSAPAAPTYPEAPPAAPAATQAP